MARIYLFAEGQTEQTFADIVLKPHLAAFNVYLHNPILIAHARKKGRVHRGGGRKYQPMQRDIMRFTAQERAGDVFFTSMIDLYAIHRDFPGLLEAEQLRNDPYRRVEYLQQAWQQDIGDSRFVPYIQLHEYEAYLFCEPRAFGSFYESAERQIARLLAIANSHTSPELIDDGEHTAPSKRIAGEFPDYERGKATIGPLLGQQIGIRAIRSKCPHFDRWLATLEQLGSQ